MLIEDSTFLVIDLETTGLDPEVDRVIEAGAVWAEMGGICASADWLFSPGIPIPASASAIHHLIDEDVQGFPKFSSERFFTGEIADVDFYAAHNAEFDGSFLKPVPKPLVCTMRLAQKLWPGLESYSNQFLRYHLDLDPPVLRTDPMHRALPDAQVTATLLLRELDYILAYPGRNEIQEAMPNKTVEELVAWVEAPLLLDKIQFGKHKGELFSNIPRDYLRWLSNQPDLDRDMIYTLHHFLTK